MSCIIHLISASGFEIVDHCSDLTCRHVFPAEGCYPTSYHLFLILTLYGIWIRYFLLIWKWFSRTARVSNAQDTFSNVSFLLSCFYVMLKNMVAYFLSSLFLLPHPTSVCTFSLLSLYCLHLGQLWFYSQKFLLSVDPRPFGKFMGLGFSTPSVHLPPRPSVVERANLSKSEGVSRSSQRSPCCFPGNPCWLL